MPYDKVLHKFKHGELHSGSKTGPLVKDRKQAIAIMLSEKRAAEDGKEEYKPVKKYQDGGDVSNSPPSFDDVVNDPTAKMSVANPDRHNSVYDKPPASSNVEDRRMGPNLPPESSKQFPYEFPDNVQFIPQKGGLSKIKPYVSPQGKAWAAKNMPKNLPTTPIAQKKGGPVTKNSETKGWRRW